MKKIISLLFILLFLSNSFKTKAQNNFGSSDDVARIALTAYTPPQVEKISNIVSSMLTNKLNQIATQNGMGGNGINNRFIITANINVISKDITATAPAMVAFDLEVIFYIGDGIEGTKFASTSVSVKGVGTNETKAYIDAIKNIKPKDAAYANFISEGKKRIVEYYNANCDMIMNEAKSYESQNNSEAAIYTLSQIPKVCKDCYTKAVAQIAVVYKKQQERDCKTKINEADAIWAAKPTIEGAQEVANILIKIDPETECYKKAQVMAKKINETVAKRMKEIDNREWQLKLLEVKSSIEIQKETLKNTRDIALAYANNQPKVIYKVSGWW